MLSGILYCWFTKYLKILQCKMFTIIKTFFYSKIIFFLPLESVLQMFPCFSPRLSAIPALIVSLLLTPFESTGLHISWWINILKDCFTTYFINSYLHSLHHHLGNELPVLLCCVSKELHGTIIHLNDVLGVIFTNHRLQGTDVKTSKHLWYLQKRNVLCFV